MLTRNIPLIMYSAPVFVLGMLLEYGVLRRRLRTTGSGPGNSGPPLRGYQRRDATASLATAVLCLGPGLLITAGNVPIALWAWHHRFFDLGTGVKCWMIALVLVDFAEYWSHRANHRIRLLWANHVQHHSSTSFNLSTSLRTPVASFSNMLFFPWLAVFGIQPWIVFLSFSINAVYQYWIHTEMIGRFPRWVELVFNTPSNHRVHHGSDTQYVDKNYAGIFIIFDRIFGTYEPETIPVTYGLIHNIHSFNIVTIITHEYVSLLRDVRAAKGALEKVGLVIMPPGWRSTETGGRAETHDRVGPER